MFQELPGYLLEPKEDKPIAYDWTQSEIYQGDEVYQIGTDLVLKDDIANYIDVQYGEAKEMH